MLKRSTWDHRHSSPFMKRPNINVKRMAALGARPVYLCEEDPEFFKTLNKDELNETNLTETAVMPLTLVTDGTAQTSPVHFNPSSMAVVVEGLDDGKPLKRCSEKRFLLKE
ncbi:hypothetical protein ATANTOWER_032080 [Ataeniobius toweri]|uniref:Uncharacterized protein n=1 Tax=Ataeniobius toweri TaxID=208326 RepID=A0ABU7A470_9TELE|nr:hypothetical protein [Ataeniobius toweri]